MDLKQVQAGNGACADGGIPVHAKVFHDGAVEVSQIIGAMRDLRQLVGEQELLMVADSKLVSYTNISALLKSKVPCIAPVPAAQISDGVYASLDLDRATVGEWIPARDTHKDSDQRGSRRVLEDVHVISTRRKSDPVLRLPAHPGALHRQCCRPASRP
ncbi:hypothetical protein ACFU93_36985 [Streptomyces sp. NPDC057611]|uniref:hypothetical protein n=1 Tax=Streptomyces sp. NPDC057611 TaxID=3346182 RepID=UPI0036946FB1